MKDDNQLIDETLRGDTDAFGDLVRRYQDRLYHTLVHQVGDAEEACDVVQEAFVQAFVKLESFQRTSAFYTWLYRIAFNVSVTRHRRQKPTVSIDRLHEVRGDEPLDNGVAPGDRMEQGELVLQVRAGLAALSEEHRTVMVLREIEGFDYDTIAEVLGVPVGTVRSRIHRARLQLREQLKGVLETGVERPG